MRAFTHTRARETSPFSLPDPFAGTCCTTCLRLRVQLALFRNCRAFCSRLADSHGILPERFLPFENLSIRGTSEISYCDPRKLFLSEFNLLNDLFAFIRAFYLRLDCYVCLCMVLDKVRQKQLVHTRTCAAWNMLDAWKLLVWGDSFSANWVARFNRCHVTSRTWPLLALALLV